MSVQLVPQLDTEPVEGGFETLVLERRDLPAALTDHVVVVLSVLMGGLVAG